MTSAVNHRYPAVQGELEDEFETEWEEESEFEGSAGRSALAGSEFETEWESEDESEWESEDESEWESEDEVEFDFEAEAENMSAAAEGEFEDEGEYMVNPVRRIYPDAELMAHLSAQAARAESEAEAEAFVGALVPLAARLVPRAGRLVARHAPTLIRGVARVTRQLRRNPTARKLVAAVPVILQRTVQSLGDQAASGQDVDSDAVVRTLSTMAGRVLGAPRNRARAVRAVRTFDRRYHHRRSMAGEDGARSAPGLARGGPPCRPSALRHGRLSPARPPPPNSGAEGGGRQLSRSSPRTSPGRR